ncbi:DUF3750 domain-containing protein [Glaciecola sp. XM2]|uniref:DUF3750 domain-containing protein n=1 Tax=Glaciecola sp. XM2 TaxID=1914931 RepID=UPI001BDF64CE|nr:DUF3750 domain-containing protein [Glaciecola sp. XM2]MBT1451497.1 DUF3750 domain-containing protein [Glaciecola sp. XM2]
MNILSKISTVRMVTLLCVMFLSACTNTDWRTASRESAGIAPDPALQTQAVIEFYAADAFSWRGWFAVHTWVAIKEQDAVEYTVYEVVGWQVDRGLPALREYTTTTPDRYWYGAKPEKFLSMQGPKAQALIPQIKAAVSRYPWANEYTLVPGPNSNTFPAWLGLQVPELELKMPFRAIGSGFADNASS